MTTIRRGIYVDETREESDLYDDEIDAINQMAKDIERSKALRELAEERVDEDALPEATTLLWIDAAEVYSLCASCYHENRDGAWTGSTENPNQFELQQQMNERLESGVPCSFCKRDRINKLKEELANEVDVEVEIHTPDGVER